MTTTRSAPRPRRTAAGRPHPAMARRRREVRGIPERGTLLLGGAVGLACAALGYWLATGPMLSVQSVRVSGYDRPDAATLTAAVDRAGDRGGSLLAPPIGAIRRQAIRFPWVEDVTLARDWPLGLVAQVIPAEPLAIGVPTRGARVLINNRGQVMGPAGKRGGLPRVTIPGAAPEVGAAVPAGVDAALRFVRLSAPKTANRFQALKLVNGRLTGRLRNGPLLVIGTPTRLRDKALALQAVLNWASAEDEHNATYIDVSVPERPALGSMDPEALKAQVDAARIARTASTTAAAASTNTPTADPAATDATSQPGTDAVTSDGSTPAADASGTVPAADAGTAVAGTTDGTTTDASVTPAAPDPAATVEPSTGG